jgi:hypothetical protein
MPCPGNIRRRKRFAMADADHWEALAEAEIDERYRECNVGRDELVA